MTEPAFHSNSPCLPPGYPFRSDWEVTPAQLRDWLNGDDQVVVVDCRTPEERAAARIEGSQHWPMHILVAQPDELDVEAGQRIVVHCHRGQRSMRVTAVLRQAGFENTWSLAGGIDAWSVYVDPTVARY
jgi:rhodanese-related sulfurtransferase